MLTLVAWALLAAGIGVNSGQFSPVALPLVLGALVVLLVVVARGGETRAPGRAELWLPAAVVVLAVVAWRPVWYASGPALRVSHLLAGLAVAAALWAIASAAASDTGRAAGPSSRGSARRRWALPAVAHWMLPAALAAAATVAMIRAAPAPSIDVWVFGQQAADAMAAGRNPYTEVWTASPGLQDVYPYLPGTTVLLLPARLLLGDVRYGLLAALLLASWAARRLALRRAAASPDGRAVAVLLPLLLLLIPRWTWSVAQAWTEPLLLAAVAGAVWAADTGRRRLAAALLAVALASKQHVVLLLPLLPRWLGPRRAVAAVLIAGLVVLPWFVAGPAAFWHDTVVANLTLESRLRSLSLASLARRLDVPWGVAVALPAVAASGVLAWRRLPRDAHGFLLGGAVVLLTLDVTNTQTFFNHYTLPLGLLVLASLTTPRQAQRDARRALPAVAERSSTPSPVTG